MWAGYLTAGVAGLAAAGYAAYSYFSPKWGSDTVDKVAKTVADEVRKADWKRKMKKAGIWSLVISIISVIFYGVYWYLFKREKVNTPTTRALFNAGYMGIDLADDLKKSESYLAGMAKRLKEDRRDEQMGKLGAKLGGLDVKHITAEYGKKTYYNNEGYHGARNY